MLRRSRLALATLLLTACPTAGMHRLDVGFTLAAEPVAATPGDTVLLTAAVTNTADEPVTLEFGGACRLVFYVVDAEGRAVHPRGERSRCAVVGAPAAPPLRLQPGETWRETGTWIVRDAAGRPLPEGDYTAYVILEEHYLVRGGRRDLKLAHRSNEVPLRVR
ncbi:MAG TPA: hypothetical protein VHG28_14400 [Longimicrobiaceae bacterium]|nr:hypothetical protein [Longimicrobiaceae bacterium]